MNKEYFYLRLVSAYAADDFSFYAEIWSGRAEFF